MPRQLTGAEKRATAPRRRATATKRRRKPSHAQISERAYYIYLDEGTGDEFGNWLRAERELSAA